MDLTITISGASTGEPITGADVARLSPILESWASLTNDCSAILVDHDETAVSVLAMVPWAYADAGFSGPLNGLALAFRLSLLFPTWCWLFQDDGADSGRCYTVEAVMGQGMSKRLKEISIRDGRFTADGGLRAGSTLPWTTAVLQMIESELGKNTSAWIGVDPEAEAQALRSNLEQRISAAFADRPYPGDKAINCFEPDEATATFVGTHWTGHDVAVLRYNSCTLSFFKPVAFCYFLPAFMLAELEDPIRADTIAESIAFHLTPTGDDNFASERVALLCPDQRKEVVAFLEYCQASYGGIDARTAIALLEADAIESDD